MGSFAAAWVNKVHPLTTVVVPSRVNSQFSSGVLFAELLVSLGWLSSAEFGDSVVSHANCTSHRLINMHVVVAALKTVVMESWDKREVCLFDGEKLVKLVPLIITEAQGAAAELLLRIKSATER